MQCRVWILAAAVACAAPKDSQVTPRDSTAPRPKDSVRAPAEDSAIEEYDRPLPPPPKIEGYPIVYRDRCVGETCGTTRVVRACADIPLHETPSKDSPRTLLLRKGDTAVAGQDIHVIAPGIVVVKRTFTHDHGFDDDGRRVPLADTLRFTEGDTIFLELYGMLGTWHTRYRGQKLLLSEFWGAPRSLDRLGGAGTDSTNAVLRSEFYMDEWWPVQLADGRIGWKLRNQDVDYNTVRWRYTYDPWDHADCP